MARRVRRLVRGERRDFTQLPPEIVETVARIVGHRSFRDLCRLGASSRRLRGLLVDPYFYASIDLWVMETPNAYLDGVANFKIRCLHHRNPSEIFLKGCSDFFKNGKKEEGLEAIRVAAVLRYDLALYTHAALFRILNPGVKYSGVAMTIDRDFVRAARNKVVACIGKAWDYDLPAWFSEKVDEIDVDGIYACKCARIRNWARAWDERVKKGEMCDACFWKIQMLGFCHDFPCRVLNWPQ